MTKTPKLYKEPQGYISAPGFVKSNPNNNENYIAQFEDDPWYPIILRTHNFIKTIAPGYNIVQIKEKFGGLRYYVDFPENSVVVGKYEFENTVEKQKARIDKAINYAEGWVEGFEYARKAAEK